MGKDNIVDELKDVAKEKLNSPIFGPFLFVLLIHNWKVVVGLFMPREMLCAEGYSTYFELIDSNFRVKESIFITIGVLLAYPIITYLVKNWDNLSSDMLELFRFYLSGKLKIKKGYYSKKEYDDMKFALDLAMNANKSLKITADTVTRMNNENEDIVKNYNRFSSVAFFDGTWITSDNFISLPQIKNLDIKAKSFIFSNGEICIRDPNEVNSIIKVGRLQSTSYNATHNTINVTIRELKDNEVVINTVYNYIFKLENERNLKGRDVLKNNSPEINLHKT